MERPIIFSGPMVRAILEERKTQTRRVVKPQPPAWTKRVDCLHDCTFVAMTDNYLTSIGKCPLGEPGDRLWVRETFTSATVDSKPAYIYKADPMFDDCDSGFIAWKWTPAIHMPRRASRIDLEIINVRVERLQAITPTDAIAEGVFGDPDAYTTVPGIPYPVATFWKLWDSIYAERGYGWDANPWVCVIEFKRIKK